MLGLDIVAPKSERKQAKKDCTCRREVQSTQTCATCVCVRGHIVTLGTRRLFGGNDTPLKDAFIDLFDTLGQVLVVSFQKDGVNAVSASGNHLFHLAPHADKQRKITQNTGVLDDSSSSVNAQACT